MSPSHRRTAMRFLLLLHGDEAAELALTPGERRAIVDLHIGLSRELRAAGQLVMGEPLGPAREGRIVRRAASPTALSPRPGTGGWVDLIEAPSTWRPRSRSPSESRVAPVSRSRSARSRSCSGAGHRRPSAARGRSAVQRSSSGACSAA